MKPTPFLRRFLAIAGSAVLAAPLANATTLYWDVNGATAGFSTVVGTWDTTNNFWNTNSTGGAGTLSNTTSAADDIIIKQATTNTGSITVSGTQLASSITFASNVGPTTTLTGGAITIGGTGASSGIFQQSTGANTISTGLTLNSANSAFNFSNSSSGLLTLGAVTGAAAGAQTITVGSRAAGGITLGGVISDGGGGGTVALTVNNTSTGVTNLTAANLFTGATTINRGTLNLGNATANGSLASTVLNLGGGTLSYTRTGTNTQAFTTTNITAGANAVTASLATQTITLGNLVRSVGGTLDIGATGIITTSTANDATGILGGWATISSNNWAVSAGGASDITGSAPYYNTTTGLNVAANYTAKNIDIDSSPTIVGNINANTIRFNSNARVLTLAAGDNIFAAGGILVNSGVTGATISGGNLLGSSGGDLIVHQFSATALTINSIIKDNTTATALTKTGTGTLILNGINTYTGKTYINAGTLQIGTNGTVNGAKLGGAGTYAGDIFIAGGANLDFQTNVNQTLSGVISGDGNLLKRYIGTLTLGDDNTYTGKTTIGAITNAGDPTLVVSSFNSVNGGTPLLANSSLGAPTTIANGTIEMGSPNSSPNPTLRYAGAAATGETTDRIINFTFNGSATRTLDASNGSGLLKFTSPFTSTGLATGKLAFTGSGAGEIAGLPFLFDTLTKSGSGTWTLAGTNIFTGKTLVQNGTISFSVGNASATADQQLGKNTALDLGVAATSSGRLLYTGGAGTLAKNINALGNGNNIIENNGGNTLTLTGTLAKNGTILVLRNTGVGSSMIVNGAITGASANSDLIVDGGTVTLGSANTYDGPTFIINGATLNANAANALPTSIKRTAVSMDQSGSGSSALAMTVSQSIASLTGAATSTVNLNANTLTIGTATGSTTFAGVISGIGGSLVKDGASILTLTNTNTYDGTTSITGGILRVNGSLSTGAVNVAAGALGGAGGTVNGAVTLSGTGGINLAAGAVGDLTLASTLNITGAAGANSLNFDLGSAAGGTDKIIVSGAPSVTNDGVIVGFNQIGGAAARINAGTYTIIQGTSAPTLTNYSLATTKAFGNTYQLQVTGNNLEVVTTQAAAGPTTVHWSGSTDGSWGTLANWKTTVSSNVTAASLPSYNTDVTFGTTTPVQGNLTTTLGADQNINSLTFTIPAAGGITIGGANMLTLESSGTAITSSNTSGTNTISANVGMAASQSWSVGSATGTLLVSGNITDFGAGRTLTKTGAGALTLSGNNTYSGGTTLSAGILNINNGGSSSSNSAIGTGTFTISGGTINNTAGAASSTLTLLTNNALALNGDFTYTGTGSRNLNLGTGAVTLSATRQITVSAGTLTIGGNITGTANGITKAGNGILTLAGNNTYTGTTTVSAGTLKLTGTNTLGAVTVNGGLFNIDGGTTSTGTLAFPNASVSIINGGTLSTVSGGAALAFSSGSSMTVTGGAATSTWNLNGGDIGTVAGSHTTGTFLIDGAGTVGSARVINVGILSWGRTLSNATLTLTNGGQMNVNGEIRTGNPYYNTTGNSDIVIGGGTAISTLTGNNQALYIGYGERNAAKDNDVTVNSGGVLTGIGNTFIGQVAYGVALGTATNNKLTVNGTGTANMASITVGYGQVNVDATNANVVQVTNGGTLTTTSGTNSIGFASVSGAIANSNTVTITGTGVTASTWNASSQNIIVGNAVASATSNNNTLTVELGGVVSSVGTLTVGSTTGTSTGNKVVINGAGTINATTITVNAGNTLQFGSGGTTSSLSQTGNITNNGSMLFNLTDTITQGTHFDNAFGGSGTVTQSGSGILVLNGANTYSGGTTVSAGSLVAGISNSGSTSGAFGPTNGATGLVTLGNAATTTNNSSPSVLIGGAFTVSNPITIANQATSGVYALGGSTANSSTFTGNITLNQAVTLQQLAGGTVEFSTGTWTTNDKAIAIGSTGNTGTVRLSNAISTSGGISVNYGTLELNSAFTSGNMTVSSGATLSGTGSVAGTTGVTGGTVNGTGLVLTDTTTFNSTGNILSGTVTSTNGVAIASSAELALNGALTGTLAVGNGTLTGTGGSVSGAATLNGGTINLTSGTLSSTLAVTGGNWNGAGTVSGVVSSTSGTFTIGSGANLTATSGVDATGGSVVIDGTLTGALTANSSTTVSGTGTVTGATTIQGTHSPGNSPGIQPFAGDLTYSGGSSVVNWELVDNTVAGRGTNFDGIDVGGALNFAGSTTLTLDFTFGSSLVDWSDTFWDTSHTGTSGWLVYSGATSLAGFSNLSITTANWADEQGDSFDTVLTGNTFGLHQDGNDVYLNYTVIPEPRAALLGGLGMLLLLRRRRN